MATRWQQHTCATGKQSAEELIHNLKSVFVTHLYPFLCLPKRGVCGRLGRRVMLMRRSYVCNRTCHWRRGSALQVLKPVDVCKSSSVPRYSTEISRRTASVSPFSPPSVCGCCSSRSGTGEANEPVPVLRYRSCWEAEGRQPRSSQPEVLKELPVWRLKIKALVEVHAAVLQ